MSTRNVPTRPCDDRARAYATLPNNHLVITQFLRSGYRRIPQIIHSPSLCPCSFLRKTKRKRSRPRYKEVPADRERKRYAEKMMPPGPRSGGVSDWGGGGGGGVSVRDRYQAGNWPPLRTKVFMKTRKRGSSGSFRS